MRAVLIENGVVVQKAAPGRTAEQLGEGWVDAPEEVSPGFTFDGEAFTAPPPPPPTVPVAVSMRQGRQALLRVGLLDAVDAAIAGITDPLERRTAQIDWQHATEIRRASPLIASLGPALGLSEAQIDSLFIAAAAIP